MDAYSGRCRPRSVTRVNRRYRGLFFFWEESYGLMHGENFEGVTFLYAHWLRNIAFYRAGWDGTGVRVSREIWKSANSAFIDIAVLEWCKLFADHGGKHH